MKHWQKNLGFSFGLVLLSVSGPMLGILLLMSYYDALPDVRHDYMYTINYSNGSYEAYGMYKGDDFIFITVDNRSSSEIARTAVHEVCHHMIYENRSHFCKGDIN